MFGKRRREREAEAMERLRLLRELREGERKLERTLHEAEQRERAEEARRRTQAAWARLRLDPDAELPDADVIRRIRLENLRIAIVLAANTLAEGGGPKLHEVNRLNRPIIELADLGCRVNGEAVRSAAFRRGWRPRSPDAPSFTGGYPDRSQADWDELQAHLVASRAAGKLADMFADDGMDDHWREVGYPPYPRT